MATLPIYTNLFFFRDYFADPANDLFNRNYMATLESYCIPATNLIPPVQVYTMACNAHLQGVPIAFLLLHKDNNLLYCYI